MAHTTSHFGLRVPDGGDDNDVVRDIGNIGADLDSLMAGATQGVLASRPAAGISRRSYFATDDTLDSPDGTAYYDNGVAWLPKLGRRLARRLPTGPGRSFPTSPSDMDRISYAIAQTNQVGGNIDWEFAFDLSIGDSNKWKFVGGPPLRTFANSGAVFNSDGSPHAVGVSAVIPFRGIFNLKWFFGIKILTGVPTSVVGGLYRTPSGGSSALFDVYQVPVSSANLNMNFDMGEFPASITETVLDTAFDVRVSVLGSGTFTIYAGSMEIVPFRVGP